MRMLPSLPALLAPLLATSALACGPDEDCPIGDRTYRIHLPPGGSEAAAGPRGGALFFAHGYRGTAGGTMGNGNLTALADRLGVALVALKSFDEDWTIPNAPSAGTRPADDEPAYIEAVKADVVARYGLDPERMMMAGFSAGGMMTWTMACERSGAFAAFVAMSGTFWAPVPASCPAPAATLHHIHGTSDGVVPIAGRPIGPTHQGDVTEALTMWRAKGFDDDMPSTLADLDCEGWGSDGDVLTYCLHPGGHSFRAEWIEELWVATFPE